jgi:hypothetical protein
MSTKINARSPFFLEFVEPTPALGAYDCNTADLQNFAVSSAGLITVPSPRHGTIIDQTDTSFAENTTGSPISRTVSYTLQIPSGYTNASDGTFICSVTADQPSQTAQEDPAQNTNCPTFSGTIPNVTDSTSTTIDLTTYFTAGSGAAISSYSVNRQGDAGIAHSVSGDTLTISSNVNCLSATFRVVAKNANDTCTDVSNAFTFSTPCTEAYDCDTAGLINPTTGGIDQDGTLHLSQILISGGIKEIRYNSSALTLPYNVGANTGGSPVTKTITYEIYIPQGYSNYSVGATINCNVDYSQTNDTGLPTFGCDDAKPFQGGFISPSGNIAPPTVSHGTLVSWTPQQFDPVSTNTARIIYLTIQPPSTGYSNSGGANIGPCEFNTTQPPDDNPCGTGINVYITQNGQSTSDGFCGLTHETRVQLVGAGISFSNLSDWIGKILCFNGSPFAGGQKWFGVSDSITGLVGNIGATFNVIRIDDFGVVQQVAQDNCTVSSEGDFTLI